MTPESTKQSLNPLSEAVEIPCDICQEDKSPSVKSCNTCQVSYCDVHLAPHLRDPLLQRHRLKDPTLFSSSHLCRIHKQPLTKFCTKDQAPVCDTCTEKEHKHHQTVCMEQEQKRVKVRTPNDHLPLKLKVLSTCFLWRKLLRETDKWFMDKVCLLLYLIK